MKRILSLILILPALASAGEYEKLTASEQQEAALMCRLYQPGTPDMADCLESRASMLLIVREVAESYEQCLRAGYADCERRI